MSKMNELSLVLDEVISCGEKMIAIADSLKDMVSCGEKMIAVAKDIKAIFTDADSVKAIEQTAPITKAKTPKAKSTPAAEPETKKYSKEDVRGILAAKANEAGGRYKASVKAIVKKYSDGGSLTVVPAESYEALIKEVEGLIDG